MKKRKKLGRKILGILLTLTMIVGMTSGMGVTTRAASAFEITRNGVKSIMYITKPSSPRIPSEEITNITLEEAKEFTKDIENDHGDFEPCDWLFFYSKEGDTYKYLLNGETFTSDGPLTTADLAAECDIDSNNILFYFSQGLVGAYDDYLPTRSDDEEALAAKVVKFNNMDWYLIKDNSISATEGNVTLFAKDTSLGDCAFDSSYISHKYVRSTVKAALDAMLESNGTFADVADAIVATDLTDLEITGEKLWLLSEEEVKKLPYYVAVLDKDWWIRTPGFSSSTGTKAKCVNTSLDIVEESVINIKGIRPALKLDLSKVDFDSTSKTFTLKPPVVKYPLWVGGVQVDETNAGDIFNDGTASFTPADGDDVATLTLNGADITKGYTIENSPEDIESFGIYYTGTDPLNVVTAKDTENYISDTTYAIDSTNANLTFSGSGSLATHCKWRCICSGKDLIINSGEVFALVEDENGTTVSASNNIIVNDGALIGMGNYAGIVSYYGNIEINGGIVAASGDIGMKANSGDIVIKDGAQRVLGIESAFFAKGQIAFLGGTTMAMAGTSAINGTVYNTIYGLGWTNEKGTEDETEIAPSEDGQDISSYKKVFMGIHVHKFTYSAKDAELSAACGYHGCSLTDNKTSFKIVAPTLTTEGQKGEGISAEATLVGLDDFNEATEKEISTADIKYVGRDGTNYAEVSTAPTAAGKYTAKITVEGVTASVDYEITKEVKPEPQSEPEPQLQPKPQPQPEPTPKAEISMNAGLKVSQKGSKVTIKWGKVDEADGYDVYMAYCNKKFGKPIKSVNKNTVKSVRLGKIGGKKINLKKNFKVYVAAYKMIDGKKVTIAKSIVGHVVGHKNAKYTNAKKIKLAKSKYTVAVGKTVKVKAKTILVNKKKKQLSNKHAKEFRYATTDKQIATVSKSGKIKGVKKGTCTVYVYARNGMAKKVTVTVK